MALQFMNFTIPPYTSGSKIYSMETPCQFLEHTNGDYSAIEIFRVWFYFDGGSGLSSQIITGTVPDYQSMEYCQGILLSTAAGLNGNNDELARTGPQSTVIAAAGNCYSIIGSTDGTTGTGLASIFTPQVSEVNLEAAGMGFLVVSKNLWVYTSSGFTSNSGTGEAGVKILYRRKVINRAEYALLHMSEVNT